MRLLICVKNFRGGIFLKIIEKIPTGFPQIPARNSVFWGQPGFSIFYEIYSNNNFIVCPFSFDSLYLLLRKI